MKKKQSRLKISPPPELLAALAKQRELAAYQERRGNFDTYDHTKLQRLEKALAEYTNDEVNK